MSYGHCACDLKVKTLLNKKKQKKKRKDNIDLSLNFLEHWSWKGEFLVVKVCIVKPILRVLKSDKFLRKDCVHGKRG